MAKPNPHTTQPDKMAPAAAPAAPAAADDESLQTDLDALADAVSSRKGNPDGTVSVDFGPAGRLTGGLVLNAVPGTVDFAAGQSVTVLFLIDENTSATLTVDGRFVKA